MKKKTESTEAKQTRNRRKAEHMLAMRFPTGGYSTRTPWESQSFPTLEKAVEATASNPEFCQDNIVVAITVSPRIIQKPVAPRKPVMMFDTAERGAIMEPSAQTGGAANE